MLRRSTFEWSVDESRPEMLLDPTAKLEASFEDQFMTKADQVRYKDTIDGVIHVQNWK